MAEKITRNDYYDMILATGRIPKDDEYEIIPIDFTGYHLNEKTQKIADMQFTKESSDTDGNYMLEGHWLSDKSYQFANACDMSLTIVDAYSSYGFSDEQMVLFTYCEGDITLTLFKDQNSYINMKNQTIAFYTTLCGA